MRVDGTDLMEFPIAHGRTVSIIGGPDGNIWFTSGGGGTGREIINRANISFTDIAEFTVVQSFVHWTDTRDHRL
jgi:hypothetical protein